MKYILKSPMLCICALYSKRQQIKFFEKIFDRCARSPRSFYFNAAMTGFSFLKISICSGVSLSG